MGTKWMKTEYKCLLHGWTFPARAPRPSHQDNGTLDHQLLKANVCKLYVLWEASINTYKLHSHSGLQFLEIGNRHLLLGGVSRMIHPSRVNPLLKILTTQALSALHKEWVFDNPVLPSISSSHNTVQGTKGSKAITDGPFLYDSCSGLYVSFLVTLKKGSLSSLEGWKTGAQRCWSGFHRQQLLKQTLHEAQASVFSEIKDKPEWWPANWATALNTDLGRCQMIQGNPFCLGN